MCVHPHQGSLSEVFHHSEVMLFLLLPPFIHFHTAGSEHAQPSHDADHDGPQSVALWLPDAAWGDGFSPRSYMPALTMKTAIGERLRDRLASDRIRFRSAVVNSLVEYIVLRLVPGSRFSQIGVHAGRVLPLPGSLVRHITPLRLHVTSVMIPIVGYIERRLPRHEGCPPLLRQ